jgi:hypothetical protein
MRKSGTIKGLGKGEDNKAAERILRSAINFFLINNMDVVKIQALFDELKTEDKLSFLKDLLVYSLPKYAPIEFKKPDDAEGNNTSWLDTHKELEAKLKLVS